MAVTTNKLPIPTSKKTGSAVSGFPDVCKTPALPLPLPLPYPGVTYDWRTSGTKGATGQKVVVKGGGVTVEGSNFGRSSGDEAGTSMGKGVVSSKQLGATAFVVRGAPKALAEHGVLSQLSRLHNDMLAMNANNPELWHAAIDNYVRLVAELYKARASS